MTTGTAAAAGAGAFDPSEPLAPRTLIEASAGTGKTYALCGLSAQLIGSGAVTVDEMLVVTFTNLATDDLRNRIRERLVSVRDDLAATIGEDAVAASADAVVRALGARDDRETVCARLDAALVDLGNLSVSTIHGFAQRALAYLGAEANVAPEMALMADDTAILDDAVSDELAIAALDCPPSPDDDDLGWLPPHGRTRAVAQLLSDVPDIDVRPGAAMATPSFAELVGEHQAEWSAMKAQVDEAVAQCTTETARKAARKPLDDRFDELEVIRSAWVGIRASRRARERRQAAGLRNYADLLTDLRAALVDRPSGPAGDQPARRLADRFKVVLIDEFQDTDRVQWDIFDACFGRGDSKLVMVGDPKQAIYRFRGADVYTYARVAQADDVQIRSLQTNQRSDGALLAACATLFDGVDFGPAAPFVEVDPSPRRHWSAIRWKPGVATADALAAMRIIFADRDGYAHRHGGAETCPGALDDAHRVDADIVDWIRRLRAGAQVIHDPIGHADDPDHWVDVTYGDIALLVDTNHRAVQLAEFLADHGIPAAVHSDDDVRLDSTRGSYNSAMGSTDLPPSEAAWHWRLVLEALRLPSDARLVRAAATSVFGPDLDPNDTVASPTNDAAIRAFQDQLAGWAKVFEESGPSALVARLRADTGWLVRATSWGDRGRFVTDLAHLGERFCAAGASASVDDLLGVLDTRNDTGNDASSAPFVRRVATDAPSVTIMTVHKAKGLEFPIVGCVGLHATRPANDEVKGKRRGARFHDTDGDVEVLDVGRSDASLAAQAEEARADDLRKLYVALTRAGRHVFVYWMPPGSKQPGPLTEVLFGGGSDEDPLDRAGMLDALVARSSAGALDGAGPAAPTIDWVDLAPATAELLDDDHGVALVDHAGHENASSAPLAVATLDIPPDRRGRRWSFTAMGNALSAVVGDDDAPMLGGTDEGPTADDLDSSGVTQGDPPDITDTVDAPLQVLHAGADFGLLVHDVYEVIDFDADRDAIAEAVTRCHRRRPVPLVDRRPGSPVLDGVAALTEGIHRSLRAPLGSLGVDATPLALCDIARRDRLSECDFDLRLNPGFDGHLDQGRAAGTLGARIAELLADPRTGLAADDPYRPWAFGLASRFAHLDLAGYLTGKIDLVYRVRNGDGTEVFHIADYKTNKLARYDPSSLIDAMAHSDYPLQALLYSVGLHRYLRWRLGSRYDPAKHLGAVTYLFVRGMTGAPGRHVDAPPGVARWQIPSRVVTGLDALFAGRDPEEQ